MGLNSLIRQDYMKTAEIEGRGRKTTKQEQECIGYGWDMCIKEIKAKGKLLLSDKEYRTLMKVLK